MTTLFPPMFALALAATIVATTAWQALRRSQRRRSADIRRAMATALLLQLPATGE